LTPEILKKSLSETAVVILNYNGAHFLAQFLPNVCQHSPFAQIVVADNGSTDHSWQWLSAFALENPQVQLIQIPENKGFCGGYNYALAQLDATYFVLLNSDVEVTQGWLEALLLPMLLDEKVGACQPKIRSFHQKDHFEYAGAAGGYLDKYGYPFCKGRLFDSLEMDLGQYDQDAPIFWATGAALLVRAHLYQALAGLDARFFAHMEEIDFCWRLQNVGWEVRYVAQSTVYHVGGGTLHKSNPKKTYFNYRNGLMMLYKNLPKGKLFSVIFTRLVLDGVSAAPWFLKGQWRHVGAIIKAHFHFYGQIKSLKKDRKEQLATVPSSQNAYHSPRLFKKSIVWQFFAKKNKSFQKLPFKPF